MTYGILITLIFYILPLISAYYLTRNYYNNKKGIKPDFSDILLILLPIINIISFIFLIVDYIENNKEKLAKKFFKLK